MRKRMILALTGILALVLASVAYAQGPREGTAQNTKTAISVSGVSAKGGTKSKPKQQPKLRLVIDSTTVNGQGQPGTSTKIKSTLPKGWKFNTSKWPKKDRCSKAAANQKQNANACPKRSVVGSGLTNVDANNGGIKRTLKITAVVLTNGNLGAFVKSGAGEVPQVNRMLEGTIRGGVWDVSIDAVVQEPVQGFPTGIRKLDFRFSGKTKVKGKTYGIAQSTGCSGGSWTFSVQNTYRTGGKGTPATDKVSCRK